jgi:hypothetical protein
MSAKRLLEAKTAKLLLKQKAQQVLRPFLHRQLSIGAAAKEISLPANAVAYWVDKLHLAGILERTQGEVCLYQAADQAFFVPFSLVDKTTLGTLYAQIQSPFLERFHAGISKLLEADNADWGVCISSLEQGLVLTITDESRGGITLNSRRVDAPATVNLWSELNLDFADAKAMQHELFEVYKKYTQKTGGQRYLLRLGCVPISE